MYIAFGSPPRPSLQLPIGAGTLYVDEPATTSIYTLRDGSSVTAGDIARGDTCVAIPVDGVLWFESAREKSH